MHYLSLDNSHDLIKGELFLAGGLTRFSYKNGMNYKSIYIDTVTEICIRDDNGTSFIRIYGYQETNNVITKVSWFLYRDFPQGYKCINM